MNYIHIRLIAPYICALLIGVTGNASAQTERDPTWRAEAEPEISLGIGSVPEYLGAKSTDVQPIPVVFIGQAPFCPNSIREEG